VAISDTFRLILDVASDKAESALEHLSAKAETAGKSVKDKFAGAVTSGIETVTAKVPGAGKVLDGLGLSAEGAGSAIAGALGPAALAGAGVAVGKFALDAATQFSDTARQAALMATNTGLSVDAASRFVAVGDDAGVSAETMAGAFGRMVKNADAGKLDAFGVAVARTKDGAVDTAATYENVARAFASTDDAGRRAALGTAAFGKQWQELGRLLDQGDVTDQLAAVADVQVFNQDDVDKANQFHDAMDNLGDAVQGLERIFGELAAGPLASLASDLGDLASDADKVALPLERLVDAAGKVPGGSGLSEWIGRQINPLHQLAQDLNIAGAAIDQFSGKHGGTLSVEGLADLSPAMADAAQKAKDAADAQKALEDRINDEARAAADAAAQQRDLASAIGEATDKALAQFNSALALQDAQDRVTDAIDKQTKAWDEQQVSGGHSADANKAVQQTTNDAAQAVLAYAANQAKAAEDAATAAGKTLDASDKNVILRRTLEEVAGSLAPGNPLRSQLQGYANQLGEIPGDKYTRMHLDTAAAEAALSTFLGHLNTALAAFGVAIGANGRITRPDHAMAGGWAQGPTVVGEAGIELVDLPAGSYVHPHGETTRMLAGAGPATTVHVHLPATLDPASVVAALRRYERRNGDWRA
jgi:hypothetical protein